MAVVSDPGAHPIMHRLQQTHAQFRRAIINYSRERSDHPHRSDLISRFGGIRSDEHIINEAEKVLWYLSGI